MQSPGPRRVTVVCLAVAILAAGAEEAAAKSVAWRVTGYSLRYQQSSQPSHAACDPQFSYPTGFDERSEAVTMSLSGLQARAIPSHAGGPTTPGVNPFGGTSTLARTVSKQLLNCDDRSTRESACNDSREVFFGSRGSFATGAFRLSTNRSRRVVRVRVTGFGFEPEILECPASDPEPAYFLGPPVPLNEPIVLRGTVPLRMFAHRTTTLKLSRSLAPPPDAATRGVPFGSARISVRIALKRSPAN